ncbi:MAG: CPBP family intramembrane metalloprotease [Clostridiales bacterium]|jgi:membrane protease YdiL (CAAX protease family)|nr:CPBP family intramembrane metalloprotease [Clostridiales bacterium]
MKKLFIGPDGCIRSGWQMILLYLAMNIAQLAIIMPINIILGIIIGIQSIRGDVSGIEAFLTSYAYQSITIALCNLISIVAIIILFKVMNRKTTENMGLTPVKRDYKDLLIGLLLGAASITLIIGINYIMGDTRFNGVHITWDLLVGLILFISVGFVEEILVRGCFQHIIYYRHGIAWAIIIPSLIFSVMHFLNPNISYIATLNIALVGIVFGIMTYKSGNLWMAIGYHITWNYFQGNIFNIEVSGSAYGRGLIKSIRVEDNLLNGGAFGIEGGLICTLLLIITIIYFGFFYKKEKSYLNKKKRTLIMNK